MERNKRKNVKVRGTDGTDKFDKKMDRFCAIA